MKLEPWYEVEGNSIRKEGGDQVDVIEMELIVDFLMRKKMLNQADALLPPSQWDVRAFLWMSSEQWGLTSIGNIIMMIYTFDVQKLAQTCSTPNGGVFINNAVEG